MTEMIGEGAFGEVWKAVLDETSAGGVPGYMVAVKTSKETKGEGAEEMLREATVMAQVSGHPNLVSLIGVVTSGAPLLLLLSLCENGSLLSLLKKRKEKRPGSKRVTLAERVKMALDTARGMEHLTANKFVHRDLAARNVLVDALLQCKIADFGLARGTAGARAGPNTNEDGEEEEYYRSRTGTFPVRWTAPEAMQTMRFTEGSDVWSFGITMIEVFTDGTKPYATMDNAAVISQVQGGYRAPQPKLCPAPMYALMLECWHVKAAGRPTFTRLVQQIEAMEPTTEPTTVNDTAESNRNTASGGAARSAVVANETYASGEVVATEPATPASAIVETTFDAGVDANDEYLNVASGIAAAATSGAKEDQYLVLSQQSEPDDVEDFEC
jgi:ephrin-B